ncbi:MAG: DUF4831 family protein [Bacteroidia bacterium]|nr:DUF4831 family protein [Bacteroidia bacterium]
MGKLKRSKLFFRVIIFFIIVIFSNCQSTRIININKLNKYSSEEWKKLKLHAHPQYYSLPKTLVKIGIITEKKQITAGPYATYADKYLGIKNVQINDTGIFRMTGFLFYQYPLPDPEQYYLIDQSGMFRYIPVSVNENGVLSSIGKNTETPVSGKNEKIILPPPAKHRIIRDLGVSGNFAEKTDTTYRTIKTDSSFYRIPVYKTVLAKKTPDEKAEEVAKHIFEIREDKISILSGENDKYPGEFSIEFIINELSRIEERYLLLFTGFTNISSDTSWFEIVPANIKSEQDTLCFFSETAGIKTSAGKGSKPVLLKLQSTGAKDNLQITANRIDSLNKSKDGIYYRIPGSADAQISLGNKALTTTRLNIAQFGVISSLPLKLLKNKAAYYEFCPETGALKSIHR